MERRTILILTLLLVIGAQHCVESALIPKPSDNQEGILLSQDDGRRPEEDDHFVPSVIGLMVGP